MLNAGFLEGGAAFFVAIARILEGEGFTRFWLQVGYVLGRLLSGFF